MGDTFTPEERIVQIIYVIKELDALMHDSDSIVAGMYQEQIREQFVNLNAAVTDMKQVGER